MASTRKQKLESVLHREIAICVQQELRDPRLGFLTILRVELTPDLATVKAYWSVLGDAKARSLAVHALTAARGYVQSHYAKVLHTRTLPILVWEYAEDEERRRGISELIGKARATDTDAGARPEPAVTAVLPPALSKELPKNPLPKAP